MQKVNQKAMNELMAVLRTCNTANAITAGVNQVITRYAATEKVVKTFDNGLMRVAIVDKDELLIGEYTKGPDAA